jgi:hypothetical protein
MLGRRGERVVRGDERDEQHPRLVAVLRRLLAQPDLRARGDVPVVLRVRRLSRSRHARHLVGGAAHRQVVADQAHQVAFALDHVHRHDGLGESAVVVVGAEMELADRHRLVAGLAQAVVPARDRAVIWIGVVPEADLVDVFAGRERRARRDADRRGRPAGGKPRAAPGQQVEIRRPHKRMAVATHEVAAVLVGHQDDEVLRSHCFDAHLVRFAKDPPGNTM